MPKTQLHIRADGKTMEQINELTERWDTTITSVVSRAVDRMYREETQMNGEELFDLFCGGQVSVDEIAAMDLDTATQQIRELRELEDDDIPMSDGAIAQRILDFARA